MYNFLMCVKQPANLLNTSPLPCPKLHVLHVMHTRKWPVTWRTPSTSTPSLVFPSTAATLMSGPNCPAGSSSTESSPRTSNG